MRRSPRWRALVLNWAGSVEDTIARVHSCAGDPDTTVRNKAASGLLDIAQAWPQDAAIIGEVAGEALQHIARESILSSV